MSDENPYQSPAADLIKPPQPGAAGGTLEDGIAGRYDFSIGEIIAESWQRISGMKGTFWLAAIVVYAIVFAVSAVFGLLTPMGEGVGPGVFVAQLFFQLVIMAVVYPLMAGFIMMGARRSVDLPIEFSTPFSYMHATGRVLLAAIVLSFIVSIGFLLFIIPGIYLSVAYAMTLPLVVDKGMRPWQAMEASRKAVNAHWFKIFGLMLVLTLITIAGIIVLIGWIWAYPMFLVAYGILYRIMFGVEEARNLQTA